MIDWNDKKSKISKYFTIEEALYLPSWGVYHIPSEKEKENIIKTAEKMDKVREFIGKPINVNCWIRPTKANINKEIKINKNNLTDTQKRALKDLNYNLFIGSTSINSAHIYGLAVDWACYAYMGVSGCKKLRDILEPKLEEFGIRMEDIKGNWIHNDLYPVVKKRFYKP